jgi:hypothetical protein
MAFGIDDTLATAAAGIKLTDTVVRTVEAYRKKGAPLDIERLIEEVRVTALEKIDGADRALGLLERMLVEKGVDLGSSLQQVIEATRWWRPDESYRLKSIRRSFNALADAVYDATDDIAALLRCRDQTGEMGVAVVESARAKHELQARLLTARSVREAIDLLRSVLLHHKTLLMR